MQAKQTNIIVAVVFVIVVVIQSLFIGAALRRIHKLEAAKVATPTQQTSANALAALNAVAQDQPAISVSDKKVYFADINLAIPLTKEATALLYGSRTVGGEPAKAMTTYDVTTRQLASLPTSGFQTELSCTPVRFAFEKSANPYNDHEKANKPVSLADGRMLQVYTYSNQKCNAQWKAANIDPSAIAALFQKATSY